MENILVIDDDEKILELVQEVLKNEHYIVETRSYVDNTNIGEFEGFDLILLDIMLPFLDGYEILERIKNIITCPVIFLSAKSSEGAKVKGLMSGADDYITKPFSIRELVARVKVALRRNLKNGSNGILINGLVFNQDSNSIKLDNGEILLTKNEFRICKILVQNSGKIFSKDELYEYLYDLDANAQLRTITEFIYSIRKKFKTLGLDPIKTIWGIGYWYVTAKKKEIDFKTDICIPMMLPFKGADICLILGNLLENAVEAAQKVDGKKYIEIKMKYDKNNILLSVTNSYSGKLLKTKDHRLKSTKTDTENHGVGLASVYRAVAKYCGTVIIDDSVSGQFKIRVLLYGGQE